MNENEQNFSNSPYRATKNLNTMIGNPDINVGSVTTSNIMENNVNINSQTVNNVENSNFNSFSNFQNNVNVQNSNMSSFDYSQNLNVDSSVNDVKTSDNFVSENIETGNSSFVYENLNNSNKFLNSEVTGNTNYVDSNSVPNTYNNEASNVAANIQYENVNVSNIKKNTKESISIPSEFKTAIFLVLILLIVLSCFETVYDFFRNLNIFG